MTLLKLWACFKKRSLKGYVVNLNPKIWYPKCFNASIFNCEILFDVSRDNFRPPPNVDSTVIKLSRNHTQI